MRYGSTAKVLAKCMLKHYRTSECAAGWCQQDGCAPEAAAWEPGRRRPDGSVQQPRVAELAASMDPSALAHSAVHLNLGLMRWRAAPALDLEKLATAKCLLLGAGRPGS